MTTLPESTRPARGDGRRALLEAAIRVVARSGLRGLTFRSVAAEAGVTHGLVNHHFGSRDALVEEALGLALEESISVSRLEPGTGDPQDLAAALPEMVAADPDPQAFQYEIALEARRRDELMSDVTRIYDEYVAAAGRELTRMGFAEDDALARVVFAALDGLTLQQVVFGDPQATRDSIERLIGMLRTLRRHDDGLVATAV